MPISARYIVRSTFAFLIVGFVALTAIVAMTFWLGERAQLYFEEAIRARDSRGAAVELRNAVQTAESAQRGYIITGNEIYLAPYGTAKVLADRQLALLRELLGSDTRATPLLGRLDAILAEKFAELDETIALKRDRRDAEVAAIFRTNRGKTLMDEANIFFSGIIRFADDRLSIGIAEQRANTGWSRLVSAVGALLIVAVVGGAAYGLTRYTHELRAARREVEALNTDLEERVAHRTADLERARDRAEVLLSEVNHRVANSLALVSSLVNLQSKAVADPAARQALAETQDRIFAISLVHKRLYGSNDVRSVALDEYLAGLLEHLKVSLRSETGGAALRYELEPVELGTDASINLGVILTEWVTNAVKYAYPEGRGEIRVRLRRISDAAAELVVEDDGVGRADDAPAQGTGLGSRIVAAMSTSLGGAVEYRPRRPGTAAHLTFSTGGSQAAAAQ